MASEGSKNVFFAERMRGFWLYSQGIGSRGISIFESYFLDLIKFSSGDVVIDCGANYADLYIHLSKLVSDIRYITFEPSPKEYECVLRNAPGQEHHRSALGKVSGPIKLYVSSKGADSSIIEPEGGYTHVLPIEAICLNDFANSIPDIKLLKLEAEGAEPEILEGALEVLDRIQYIAADGGAERGTSKHSTIESITNTLLNHGFELFHLDIKSGKGRALFRNKGTR
jgi:FkbM family methyltransferase